MSPEIDQFRISGVSDRGHFSLLRRTKSEVASNPDSEELRPLEKGRSYAGVPRRAWHSEVPSSAEGYHGRALLIAIVLPVSRSTMTMRPSPVRRSATPLNPMGISARKNT